MKLKKIVLVVSLSALFTAFAKGRHTVQFIVDYTKPMIPISPYIYGSNQMLSGDENWTIFRLGGNRMTGYNWENNASNAGKDWYHQNDAYMTSVFGIADQNKPGAVVTTFHERSLDSDAASIITVQMAGYVAKDKKGPVSEEEKAPSLRWCEIKARKGSDYLLNPDPGDDFVYMDEFINFLVKTYGTSDESDGVFAYCLDNEPALWSETHPRIHPEKTLCREIVQKTTTFASVIKQIDPGAQIMGPCLYGFAAYTDFQGAPDWGSVKKGKKYDWFIDYYLDEMKIAEADSGIRLLDIFTVHWYPEAKGDQRITSKDAITMKDNMARVQAPRTLWDPTYTEDSWIGQWGKSHLPLIPKLMASIQSYYPGTRLAFNEIVYGGPTHISGTIAMADVLGIFAKYNVYLASLWPLTDDCPNYSAAYKIFRNYDGRNSTFGDYYAVSSTSDIVNSSIYGSASDSEQDIHLIAINKSFENEIQGHFTLCLKAGQEAVSGRVWFVDSTDTEMNEIHSIPDIQNNVFTYTLPAASVCHMVIHLTEKVGVEYDTEKDCSISMESYPNPFNSTCRIRYEIPATGAAQIDIISLKGEKIKTFEISQEKNSVSWDGMNSINRRVSSGFYLVVLSLNQTRVQTNKIIYLK